MEENTTPATAPAPASEKIEAKPKAKPAPKVKPKRETSGRPGRPPGSPNKPKAVEPLVKARRKAPSEYRDTKAALDSLAKDAKAVAEKHNREHPGDKWEVIVAPAGELRPKLSAAVCSMLFERGADMVGTSMAVDTRPTPEAVAECGKAWSAASAYLPDFDPKWMALALAAMATMGALAPMFAESKARKMGLIAPSEHIGPYELATKAKEAGAAMPVGSGVA